MEEQKEVKEKKITKKELEKQRKLELKKLWMETRQKVIDRDKGCVICGSRQQMNVHHIIPRENEEYFFDTNNLITLCIKHHKFGSPKADLSAHRNSFPFYLWLEENKPEQFEYCKKISKKLFLENITREDNKFVWC
jgi:5-methylcytosine-specific restriction endonuclease McrA